MKDPRVTACIDTLRQYGIHHPSVLAAFQKIPRELFVEPPYRDQAYADTALPIACDQTISQPYIVARMTSLLLEHCNARKILEIGTGSGYQAAILSQCVTTVYTVERIKTLYLLAQKRFADLHLTNLLSHHGDGYQGWPEHAPYDGIIVTAAAPEVPPALLAQLAEGGCLVIPIGDPGAQALRWIIRNGDTYDIHVADPVRFVPLLPNIL